jgi:hypothetical protein
MPLDRMSRNDFILLAVFVTVVFGIVLIVFAPVANDATLTMRLWAIAGSPFPIAVVSTFIAAFAGTWGAQLLAERMANRRALLAEIRATNASLGLIYNITNTYIVIKKQVVRDLVRDYESQVAERRNTVGPFKYRLELRSIFPPFSPIEELQQMLRDRITPDGRAMILLTPLIQSIRGFAYTATQRNEWIEEVRAMPEDDIKKAAMFFGVPYAAGRTDDRYPNFISALNLQTDDCIAYSLLLGQSLVKYAERLAARYGDGAPEIPRANFDKASELLPDMSAYADWIGNKPESQKSKDAEITP